VEAELRGKKSETTKVKRLGGRGERKEHYTRFGGKRITAKKVQSENDLI